MTSRCPHCDEEILDGEPVIPANDGAIRFHRACFMRTIIGSVAHIERRCSCFIPGSTESDQPGLTRRQAAEAAVRLSEKMQARWRLRRNAFDRWIIIDAGDGARAWSGSSWVDVGEHGFGVHVQVSNFVCEQEAIAYALAHQHLM